MLKRKRQQQQNVFTQREKTLSPKRRKTQSSQQPKLKQKQIFNEKYVQSSPQRFRYEIKKDFYLHGCLTRKPGWNKIVLRIDLPQNYPLPSQVPKSQQTKQKGLFSSHMKLASQCNHLPEMAWKHYYQQAKNTGLFETPFNYCLVIESFYIHPKSDNKIMLNQMDQFILQGLGKKSLCIGIQHFVNNSFIIPDETLVLLNAVAADSDQITYKKEMDRLMKNPTQVHQKFQKFDPDAYKQMKRQIQEPELTEEIAEMLVLEKLNQKLVQYYRKKFGFQILDNSNPDDVVMGVPLSIFLHHCKQ